MVFIVCLLVFCFDLAEKKKKFFCQNVLVCIGTEIQSQLSRNFIYTNSLLPKNILVFELHVPWTLWERKSLTKFQQVFLLLQEGLYFQSYKNEAADHFSHRSFNLLSFMALP